MELPVHFQATPCTIRASLIKEGEARQVKNPRRQANSLSMEELMANMKERGLLQPILVRRVGEGYELVAGSRRLKAFKTIFGEDKEIPALLRDFTAEEAHAAATSENTHREPMTPVEEAEAAAKVLGDCGGEKSEAARRMGWSLPTLEKRLSLMYATESVRAALQDGKILLGHAELLAACRKEAQEEAIASLLAAPKLMTVEALKAYINAASLELASSIFDKADCGTCVHNSGNQTALFTEAIQEGRCTNKQCFDRKTEDRLGEIVKSLKDEFQVVRVVRPGENFTVIPLVGEGPKGVGVEQALACRTCEKFGAAVSGVPDKLGRVYRNLCMDVPCNVRMVAKRIAAEKVLEQSGSGPDGGTLHQNSAAGGAQGAASVPSKGGAKSGKPTSASSEPSMRVKEYREKLWRQVFKRVVTNANLADNRSVLMALCLTNPGHLNSGALKEDLKDVLPLSSMPSFGSVLQAVRDLDQKVLGQALGAIAGNVKDGSMGMDLKDVVSTLKCFEVKLEDYWKVSSDFFSLLTKNEIDAVAQELGIKSAMGAEYAKARSLGKDDFIAAIMAVKGFDYTGRIPKLMTW